MTSIHVPDMLYAALLAVVLIFAVKYLSGVLRAWAQGAGERRYRALAERAVAWTDANGFVWLFGGYAYNGAANTRYELNDPWMHPDP